MQKLDQTMPAVDILMATYIPEDKRELCDYLGAQTQSLVQQDYRGPIRILVRDDGSFYDVRSIISDRELPPNVSIEFVEDDLGNLGYVKNFERLMFASEAPYVLLSDQDDVSAPKRVSVCVSELQKAEASAGADGRALVFNDARFCDQSLNVLHPSMNVSLNWRFSHAAKSSKLPTMPEVYGCTMALNQALVKAALPIIDVLSINENGLGMMGTY